MTILIFNESLIVVVRGPIFYSTFLCFVFCVINIANKATFGNVYTRTFVYIKKYTCICVKAIAFYVNTNNRVYIGYTYTKMSKIKDFNVITHSVNHSFHIIVSLTVN